MAFVPTVLYLWKKQYILIFGKGGVYMEKIKYEVPEIEIICFEVEDVITTSGDDWELPIA